MQHLEESWIRSPTVGDDDDVKLVSFLSSARDIAVAGRGAMSTPTSTRKSESTCIEAEAAAGDDGVHVPSTSQR